MSAIGGQPLAGSGFESERTARGFQPATQVVASSDAPASAQQPLVEETAASVAGVGSGVSGVTSVHSATLPPAAPVRTSRLVGVASTVQRVQRDLTRAAYQMNAMRRRFPSDGAPSATPPRMQLDHHED